MGLMYRRKGEEHCQRGQHSWNSRTSLLPFSKQDPKLCQSNLSKTQGYAS
ncbi:hypothetical protein Nmel_003531, partial [Mimus melanotis]